MEGKRLYYSKKMCGCTMCRNYHTIDIENIEENIIALFDIHALNNGIIPKPTTLLRATHSQYIDITGTIHIRPMGMVPDPFLDVVNLRLLTLPNPFLCYQSIETHLEPVIELYEEHLEKPNLKLWRDRWFSWC